ncbi:ribonucleotide-diphosphate reductase subunit beta [Candidatus Macondimonas diazotrophica]|jgi:ribonucleoside-diphosphate reductase beta chain|uniref:ribonucleotide-diphosphate reductase subunit beta n=1 Tax=Candidatus Macondimonas diazotrophica TaxID=2305248 RepID=UPI0014324FC1|nr:ribonucleotide-diphosphate reductase subunit beta [Candidatus Macondimonas diazotrophica]
MTQQNLFPSPVFQERSNYKPFDYPWAFEAYDLQQKMHWLPHEVPLAEDVKDWNFNLSEGERELLTQLFRFFTQADSDISEGYASKYIPVFPKPELRMMLMAIAASEANHMHSYSLLIDTLGLPDEEYVAFREYKAMADKHDYMFKRQAEGLSQEQATALDLAVFSAFGEGLQLFSTFAILMNFQRRGKMKGMSTIVEWSIRDEGWHVDSMTRLFRTVIEENPHIWTDDFKGLIYQACRDMVRLEDAFIDTAFATGEVDGLTAEDVKEYIRYIADRRLMQIGLKSNYGVESNPFDWLDWIMSAPTHANVFEQRSTEYGKGTPSDWEEAMTELPELSARNDRKNLSVVIYSKPGCSWCAYAKAVAQSRGVAYEIRSHEEYPHKTEGVSVTWPRIFHRLWDGSDGDLIGGATDFVKVTSTQG